MDRQDGSGVLVEYHPILSDAEAEAVSTGQGYDVARPIQRIANQSILHSLARDLWQDIKLLGGRARQNDRLHQGNIAISSSQYKR